MKVRIGIDPGKYGAISIFKDGKLDEAFPFPLLGKGSGAVVDEYRLSEILKDLSNYDDVFVCLENVHAVQQSGATSAFNFGDNCGFIRGLLTAFEIPFEKTLAKDWQKFSWTGVTKVRLPDKYRKKKNSDERIKVKGKVDTKATSTIAAQRLFPTFDFRGPNATPRKKNPHDGIVDATLIGYYCAMNF